MKKQERFCIRVILVMATIKYGGLDRACVTNRFD